MQSVEHTSHVKAFVLIISRWTKLNEAVDITLRDAVHILDQGVVYVQNVIRFHGARVNMVPFTSVGRARHAVGRFSRNSRTVNSM